jgi:hypothetical protein
LTLLLAVAWKNFQEHPQNPRDPRFPPLLTLHPDA